MPQTSRSPDQHDIFCPTREWFEDPFRDYWVDVEEGDLECTCELINKVRADEQQRTRSTGAHSDETTGLAKARAMIQALICTGTERCTDCEQYREAIACIDSVMSGEDV